MKPIICFFEQQLYIYSTDYLCLQCPAAIDTKVFLNSIEYKYFNDLKIVQLNFDSFLNTSTSSSNDLYPSTKASVFVLKKYELLTLQEIKNKFKINTNINNPEFNLLMKKNQFIEKVQQIKSMIANGRFYQVNLTSAFKSESNIDSLDFFFNYSDKYIGDYKCYLPYGNQAIISFSPELFLNKKNDLLITRPIKGSLSKDLNSDSDLIKNKKEQAELSMIVDLLRNDLNSIETNHSATVTKHRELMQLNYIQHTYSEIQIKTNKNLSAILEKTMPGGSISGCPKLESLKAINELEPTNRSAYTGSIGWWKQNDFSLNIAIRTFIQNNENYFYFAGCGIVYDSDPEKEFQELLNKTGQLKVKYD